MRFHCLADYDFVVAYCYESGVRPPVRLSVRYVHCAEAVQDSAMVCMEVR